MSDPFPAPLWCALLVVLLFAVASNARAADVLLPLTLHEAEQLALGNDPLLPRFTALAAAEKERAVADAQLPDPQLSLGLQDLPFPNISLTDDEFTQLGASVQQSFPAGETRRHRGDQALARASTEQARADEQARRALREVRLNWLEVYFQRAAVKLIRENHKLFAQLVEITQSLFAASLVNQQDVLAAQLELSLLQDRASEIDTAVNAAEAGLARWIGVEPLARPLADEWDAANLPERDALETALEDHPLMRIEDALIQVGQSGVALARDQYEPSWNVELGYGLRGGGRDDFLTGMVTVDLPIFTDKRQDRRLAASQQEVFAARHARDDRRRELREMLNTQYSAWQGLGERQVLHDKQLLPQARQNTESALNAYQSGVSDFPTLVRAQSTELETHLSLLRLRIDRAKAHANLLYLAGEGS